MIDSYNNALVCIKKSKTGKVFLQRKRLKNPSPETLKVQSVHYWNDGKRLETIKWIMKNFMLTSTQAYTYFNRICKYGRP